MPEEQIGIVPNGIDLSEYADLPPKGLFKKKFNIDRDKKVILYLGRIHKTKGNNIIVKPFIDIVKKLDNVKIVIIDPDEGYLKEIKALIKKTRWRKIF